MHSTRHLQQQGIAPARDKKIASLSPWVKKLVRILDSTFPRESEGLLLRDELAAALWEGVPNVLDGTSRSTKSSRRKKLAEYSSAVSGAKIGYHILISGELVAIRRGRRFRGYKDTAIWIEEERRRHGVRCIRLPTDESGLYWEDPWLRAVVGLLPIGWSPYFTSARELEPLVRLSRLLLDPTPLYALFEYAIKRGFQDRFPDDLAALAQRSHNPDTKRAALLIAQHLKALGSRRDYLIPPDEFIDDADDILNFMEMIEEVAPRSYPKVAHFRAVILPQLAIQFAEDGDPFGKTIGRCEELRSMEKRGEWNAPSDVDLAAYRAFG